MTSRSRANPSRRRSPPGYPRLRPTQRAITAGVVVAAHLAVLILLFSARPPPVLPEPEAMTVSLITLPPPPAPAPAPASSKATGPSPKTEPAPPRPRARAAAPRRRIVQAPSPIPAAPTAGLQPGVSEAALADAITAGSGAGDGGGGRRCDMVRRLQAALRRDPKVQIAAAEARRPGSRAILVWDGDWIQSPGEAGKGLASVRQAIALEVAFAPEACRAQPVRGLVLLTMNDAPGSARLVLGGGVWRWTDLLQLR